MQQRKEIAEQFRRALAQAHCVSNIQQREITWHRKCLTRGP